MRQARDASKGLCPVRLSGSESAAPLAEDDNCEPETLYVDQRFSHTQQLLARLDFVR